MNYVFLSPHFPPNFKYFVLALKQEGIRVLGIGSDPYENLDPDLIQGLTEYYRVEDMEAYDQLLRAVGHFTFRYGKVDVVESHNEYWLETDARLRTDFNVPGYKIQDIDVIKKKSEMKKVFKKAGIPVARGQIMRDRDQVGAFVEEVGFPLVAKPDTGVGAADTYKIEDAHELDSFLFSWPEEDYLIEEFIEGEIHTFDGLADREGKPVFLNSFVFHDGVMETVAAGLDQFYYSQRQIPDDLKEMGLKVLKAFGVKARFFHFEFFRTPKGELVALEVNIRPPGGQSLDMFNYANDLDLYQRYARMMAGRELEALPPAPYYCGYIGIKKEHAYCHSIEEAVGRYGPMLMTHGPVPSLFSAALGDYAFIIRARKLDDLLEASRFILEQKD